MIFVLFVCFCRGKRSFLLCFVWILVDGGMGLEEFSNRYTSFKNGLIVL